MAVIHFGSGATHEVSQIEFKKLQAQLIKAATRMWDDRRGTLIILSPSVIDFISYEASTPVVDVAPFVADVAVEKAPAKTTQEREEERLASIIAKSDCTHPDAKLCFSKMRMKNGEDLRRYFRACDFCGYKTKFIAKDSLSVEEIDSAVEYQET